MRCDCHWSKQSKWRSLRASAEIPSVAVEHCIPFEMMVAAAPAPPPIPSKNPNLSQQDLSNPSRPPLFPSEKDNASSAAVSTAAAPSRRPRIKDVTSRYLSSYSSSSSTSNSSATPTTTSTSTVSSSSSSSSRRFPSPLVSSRPAAQTPASSRTKRSQSVDRTRPATPRSDPQRTATGNNAGPSEMSAAARALCTTTRSLSVSFQGESFFYQTSKAKSGTPNPARKATPERRRASTTPSRSGRGTEGDQVENSRPGDQHRWPAASRKDSNPLMRSLDCSFDKKEPLFAAVRLLQNSMVFDEGRRASFDGGDLSASSDTDSVSSGSNSGAHESSIPPRSRVTSRGISVPARFWQETNSRLRRLPEPGTPSLSPIPRAMVPQKMVSAKRSLISSPMASPRSASSPLRGPVRSSSPCKVASSPSRAMASPSRTRNSNALVVSSPIGQPGPAPSILSFAAEVRRAKNGENRIEEAHLLRLLHNHHLQWRCVNAKANAALMVQRLTAEKNIYNAWVTLSEMRDSITIKKIKLQLLTQNMKLTSILKGQMAYLEEWSHMDREHSSSLSGATEALKASTLRLPIVAGARADIQDVKETVGSAVDVMQAMGSSICSLLSKVEGTSSLVSELTKVASQERALLAQARDLLSTVAVMHVKQCSLRGQLLQLKRKAREMQLQSR